jgi:hypothetical protein
VVNANYYSFDWEAKDLPDFSADYLPALFASLSAGSSKEALTSQFIISQCWSKIQLRWDNTEKHYYKSTRLPFRNWKLGSNERIPVGRVRIRASTAAALLKLQITVTQEGGTSYGVFDQASVHLWLRLLTTLFHTIGGTLRKGHRTREELFSLYMYLLAFDEVLRGIPATLWELRSIRHCLSTHLRPEVFALLNIYVLR